MAAKPIKLQDPWITLGTDSAGPPVTVSADLTCFSSGVHLVPEEDDAAATFCDPLGFAWVLTIDLKMSLGPDSLDEALTAIGGPGTVVPFEFAYRNEAASATNPHWTGEVRLVAYAIVDAGINEVTEINLEMDVIGDITRDDGTVLTVLGATGSHTHASKGTVPADTTTEPELETAAA
jgi:hypothetical protein